MSLPPSALRPVGVGPLTLRTRRCELAALQAGAPGGPAVVLVPGFTGSKEDFLPVLPLLAGAGLRAVAYDQLGQFESAGTSEPADYVLDRLADDLIDVAAALAPVSVVGHSLGGLVVRHAVIERPELFATVTLLDSGPGPLPRQYHAQLTVLRQLVGIATLEQIWQLKEGLDREAGVLAPPPDVREFLHRRWLANDPESLGALAGILMAVEDRTDELAATLAHHRIPARVVFGVDDATAWPVGEQEDMARRLAIPAQAIPGAAHSPAVENPDATAAAIVRLITIRGV